MVLTSIVATNETEFTKGKSVSGKQKIIINLKFKVFILFRSKEDY